MKLETKIRIAKATLILLTGVVSVFLFGLLVLVLCTGLQINLFLFKETTTSFLIAAFVGLIGVATVLVLLNVSVNLSLIADAKIRHVSAESRGSWPIRWLIFHSAAAFLLVGIVFIRTYLSKKEIPGCSSQTSSDSS